MLFAANISIPTITESKDDFMKGSLTLHNFLQLLSIISSAHLNLYQSLVIERHNLNKSSKVSTIPLGNDTSG
jgi:hypothetical protein